MDAIRFRIERTDTPAWGPVDAVSIFINDRNLVDLAREAEFPSAAREGKPRLAGNYIGLPAEAVFLPSRRFLGFPEGCYDDWGGRISVLGCVCGVVGCWPLQVRITATEDRVIWKDSKHPYRKDRRQDRLGPFVFDRAGYEAELQTRRV